MRAIEHINLDRDAPDYQSPANLRVVNFPSPTAAYAAKAREAHVEAMACFDNVLSLMAEASIQAAELLQVAGPSVLGVGRHARLSRAARDLAVEVAQISHLPRT